MEHIAHSQAQETRWNILLWFKHLENAGTLQQKYVLRGSYLGCLQQPPITIFHLHKIKKATSNYSALFIKEMITRSVINYLPLRAVSMQNWTAVNKYTVGVKQSGTIYFLGHQIKLVLWIHSWGQQNNRAVSFIWQRNSKISTRHVSQPSILETGSVLQEPLCYSLLYSSHPDPHSRENELPWTCVKMMLKLFYNEMRMSFGRNCIRYVDFVPRYISISIHRRKSSLDCEPSYNVYKVYDV